MMNSCGWGAVCPKTDSGRGGGGVGGGGGFGGVGEGGSRVFVPVNTVLMMSSSMVEVVRGATGRQGTHAP